MASLASPTVSSAHPNPYEASLITALRRDLHAEKSAHEETRHRLTLHISTLEAQLAFREAELEGCAARIGAALGSADNRCRSCQRLLKADAAVHRQSADTNKNVNQPRAMSSGGIVHNDYSTPDAVLRVLDAARAKSRSLEQDIKDISAKVCLSSTIPFPSFLSFTRSLVYLFYLYAALCLYRPFPPRLVSPVFLSWFYRAHYFSLSLAREIPPLR